MNNKEVADKLGELAQRLNDAQSHAEATISDLIQLLEDYANQMVKAADGLDHLDYIKNIGSKK